MIYQNSALHCTPYFHPQPTTMYLCVITITIPLSVFLFELAQFSRLTSY